MRTKIDCLSRFKNSRSILKLISNFQGGVPIEMEFSIPFPSIPYAFYLVFEGSKARHVSKAQLVHCSNDGRYLLLATAPPHDRIEATDLHAYYRLEPSSAPVLFHSTKFQFMSDAAYQVRQRPVLPIGGLLSKLIMVISMEAGKDRKEVRDSRGGGQTRQIEKFRSHRFRLHRH